MLEPKEKGKEQERVLPKALADDLAALHEADLAVPPEVDHAVLAVARQHIAAGHLRRSQSRPLLRWAPAGALAAVLIVCALVLLPNRLHRAAHEKVASPARVWVEREDIDRSGQVDILDAFTLARRIESGAAPQKTWDVNGDGAVNDDDVRQVALAAVSLGRSRLQ